MIKECLDGEVDMVITKSISRFARNTLDTLKYVRTLKEKNIAVFLRMKRLIHYLWMVSCCLWF